MAEDWYLASVREVEGTAERLRATVDELVEGLRVTQEARQSGATTIEILEILQGRGGRNTRLAPTVAFREFERTVTVLRSQLVRSLVEDHGLSFSEIAARMGVSRQMIGRLYRGAATGE